MLALWATEIVRGRATVDDALHAIVFNGDEGHHLDGEGLPFSANPHGPTIIDWLGQLPPSLVGVRAVLLPAPGLLGLPPRPDVLAAVEEAGEGVVTIVDPANASSAEPSSVTVLAPEVLAYGPADDQGTLVTWHSFHGPGGGSVAPNLGLGPAEQQLRAELSSATTAFEVLGLSPSELSAPRLVGVGSQLPPGVSSRVVRTVMMASQVLQLCDAAELVVDSATTSWEVDSASRTLRSLAGTARAALMAATVPDGWA